MRGINKIIIHCAYTEPKINIGAAEIDTWHRQRGFRAIGYHYVIRRCGVIEKGRPEEQVGAHVVGHNADSIGICLIGGMKEEENKPEFNYTLHQIRSLEKMVTALLSKYPGAKVFGHRDFAQRECPCFNAIEMFK